MQYYHFCVNGCRLQCLLTCRGASCTTDDVVLYYFITLKCSLTNTGTMSRSQLTCVVPAVPHAFVINE